MGTAPVIHPSGTQTASANTKYDLQPSVLKRSELPQSNKDQPKARQKTRRSQTDPGDQGCEEQPLLPRLTCCLRCLQKGPSAQSEQHSLHPHRRGGYPGEPKPGTATEGGLPVRGRGPHPGTAGAAAKASTGTSNLDFWEYPPRVPATTGPWISGSIPHVSLDLWQHPPRVQMALVLAWTFTFILGAGKAQTASQM